MNEFAAWVGWDWADHEHELSVREAGKDLIESMKVGGRPEALHAWAAAMLKRFEGRPIAVAIDAGRGAVISAFIGYPHIVIYPINPKAATDLRRALYPSGKKDDPVDSAMLLEFVDKHRDRLRPMDPADPLTRELAMLTEHRRKLEEDRTREVNRLRDILKSYYPQILDLFEDLSTPMVCDFLERWPSIDRLQRARRASLVAFFRQHGSRSEERIKARLLLLESTVRLTDDPALVRAGVLRVQSLVTVIRALITAIEQLDEAIGASYANHPEHDLIDSFPGLGAVLGPRVVAILGCDRDRFDSDEALQRFTGVAPITTRTGGTHGTIAVHRRLRRSKFIHQTVVEWANYSIGHCAWAKATYLAKKDQNPKAKHYVIVRALAFKWMRILFRCWHDRTKYDELVYQRELIRRGSPIAKGLAAA